MLNCLTYVAFVYWALATVHTVLPVDVALCGADAVRGGLGALFKHAFGGELDVDVETWRGFPCNSGLLTKLAFLLRRPAATVRHIMYGGGQDQPFVPILFVVPLIFMTIEALRRLAGVRLVSETASRTFLKIGVAVGCRSVILLHSLWYPAKESVYYKRYSKVEFCIIAWTAYIIELPVWHEALVSGGTAVFVLLLCLLFPHHMLPDVNPINVATQAVAAAAFGIGHAYYLQRRRVSERAARAAAKAAAVAAAAAEEERQLQLLRKEAATSTSTSAAGGGGNAAAAELTATDADDKTSGGGGAAVAAEPLPRQRRAAATRSAPAAAASAGSLATLRRIHAMAGRSYVSPARPCRFAIKIEHAHLSDLPPQLMSVLNAEVLAGSGWQAVSAHAREGCVELVLDLRPLVPVRAMYGSGNDGAATDDRMAQPDQDRPDGAAADGGDDSDDSDVPAIRMDAAARRELGRSILSYLHRTGVIRPEREQSVVLQLDQETIMMQWQPNAQIWEMLDTAEATAAAAAQPPAPPELSYVSPRVAAWPGGGSCLHLTALVAGPSAEEVLAGGGLVVRSAAGALRYSVLHVQPQAAAAAGPAPPLLLEVAVSGVQCSGLLQVEARSSAGLLSAPLAVVVDYDATLVSGLAAIVAAMDDVSADPFLRDYGSWLGLATARATSAMQGATMTDDTYDIRPGGCGGVGNSCVKGLAMAVPGSGAAADGAGAVLRMAYCSGPLPSSIAGYTVDAEGFPDLCQELRDQAAAGGRGSDVGAPSAAMLGVAADLLGVCCRGAGADGAIAVVIDRLIECVVACDDSRPPAAALAVLLDAVPSPPTSAGALHMAVAAGSRATVEVLIKWHERLYGSAGGGNPWLCRACCGVTPLHVAAAMPDGGTMAAWILGTYDTAAAAWAAASAASEDGLTPAALAAQLVGRWRPRVWQASGVVRRAIRRALAPPPRLAAAVELLFGFRDSLLERRFAETVSSPTIATLALYTTFNALLSLLSLAKAALYGSSETAFAALAFHLPHAAPLLAWFCQGGSGTGAASAAPAAATPRPHLAKAAQRLLRLGGCCWCGGGLRAGQLKAALLAMHLCRAAAKAAVGLSLWPFAPPLPAGTAAFVARGGDIALEAVVRPLLEQVGLPARVLVCVVDFPAMWLLYRGLDRRYPGLVARPMERALLYQVVLLATTAAISAANRARFLRSQEAARPTWDVGRAAASKTAATMTTTAMRRSAASTAGPSSSFSSSSSSSVYGSGGGGKAALRTRQPSGMSPSGSGCGGGGGKGRDASGGGEVARTPRMTALRGDDKMAAPAAAATASATAGTGDGNCHVRLGWTWLRGR